MGKTIRLTMAQAIVHFMKNQKTVVDGETLPIFGGVWAIFGHGNVAGMGEALYQVREDLPTFAPTTSRAWRMRRSPIPSLCSAAGSWPARHPSAPAR